MSESSTSLIDLKPLSEPAVKLIDSISNAIGILYEPTYIRKKAQAEADAAIILAKNHEEIQEIELRAANRLRIREVRRQKNLEAISGKAISMLPSAVSDESVNEDWIYNFIESAQDISDDQMQELWAKILAGEVAQPQSFSKRTLGLLQSISSSEAKLFDVLCQFNWKIGGDLTPIIFNEKEEIYSEAGLSANSLLILQSTGLISFSMTQVYNITPVNDRLDASYFNNIYKFVFQENVYPLSIGRVLLTNSGKELAKIAQSKPNPKFENYVLKNWQSAHSTLKINKL